MKQKKITPLSLAVGLAFSLSGLQAQTLVSDNFNSYSSGANLQTQSSDAWRTNQSTSFDVAATGIGGSQAAEWDSATNVTFAGYTFQTSFAEPTVDASVTAAIDFRFSLDASATTSRNTVGIGFSHQNLANFGLHGQLQRLSSNDSWRLKSSGGGTQAVVSSADMGVASETSGTSNWLRIETTLTKLLAADSFEQTVVLWDLGATGTDTPSIVQSVAAQTFTNANLYGASDWYGFFVGDRPDDIGMSALTYDNFAATAIPEPSQVALLTGALALGLLLLRRRRS